MKDEDGKDGGIDERREGERGREEEMDDGWLFLG